MGEFFGFILFWLLIMALIGVALKVVAIWGQKKASEKAEENNETTQKTDE